MKFIRTAFAFVLASATMALAANADTFTLASRTFASGGTMPLATAYPQCKGTNVSPELHWSGAPAGTKSFALTVFDPDAQGGWYHWVRFNIPETTSALPAGAGSTLLSATGNEGFTSFRKTGYGGPCPPSGPAHHYVFTLYALDEHQVPASATTKATDLQKLIKGHVLGRATLTGRFST